MTGQRLAVDRHPASERLYRAAFHAYPRRWRSVHQREALAVLLDRADDRGGRVSWADGVDLLVHGLRERFRSLLSWLQRLTPVRRLGMALVVAVVVVAAVGVEHSLRPLRQTQIQAAFPATAQVNTTTCPAHLPRLPSGDGMSPTVRRALRYQLEPLSANRLLLCRYTGAMGLYASGHGGTLATQRLVTDPAIVSGARDVLNATGGHTWWDGVTGIFTDRAHSTPQPRQQTMTELVFGTQHTALAIQLDDDPTNTPPIAAFDNGVLAPSPTRAGTDLGHRVIRDLLDARTTTRD